MKDIMSHSKEMALLKELGSLLKIKDQLNDFVSSNKKTKKLNITISTKLGEPVKNILLDHSSSTVLIDIYREAIEKHIEHLEDEIADLP